MLEGVLIKPKNRESSYIFRNLSQGERDFILNRLICKD